MRTAGRKREDRVSIVDVADGEFMLQKLEGLRPNVAKIEKQFGLRPGQLANYRANWYSRKKAK
jgi:hypothetical protein